MNDSQLDELRTMMSIIHRIQDRILSAAISKSMSVNVSEEIQRSAQMLKNCAYRASKKEED